MNLYDGIKIVKVKRRGGANKPVLTPAEVEEIVKRYEIETKTTREIAQEFHVSPQTIRQALSGKGAYKRSES